MITLTKSMAAELAPKNIRVNAINPVMGETGMLTQFMGMEDTPQNRAKFLATIPLGRLSRPHDIANAALFLAAPDSSFITGVAMEVDGGRCVLTRGAGCGWRGGRRRRTCHRLRRLWGIVGYRLRSFGASWIHSFLDGLFCPFDGVLGFSDRTLRSVSQYFLSLMPA